MGQGQEGWQGTSADLAVPGAGWAQRSRQGSSTKASTTEPGRSTASWGAEQKPLPVDRSPRTPNRQAPAPAGHPAWPRCSGASARWSPGLIRSRALSVSPLVLSSFLRRLLHSCPRSIPSSREKPSQTWSVPRLRTHRGPGRDSRNVRSGGGRGGREAPRPCVRVQRGARCSWPGTFPGSLSVSALSSGGVPTPAPT